MHCTALVCSGCERNNLPFSIWKMQFPFPVGKGQGLGKMSRVLHWIHNKETHERT
jgi:hypothetical protein